MSGPPLARQLDRALVRLGAAVAEEDLVDASARRTASFAIGSL